MITEAAGILFLAPKGTALFLKRGPGGDYPMHWGFPGGGAEGDEDAIATAIRETQEEAGRKVPKKDLTLLTRSIQPRQPQVIEPMPADSAAEPVAPPEPDCCDFTTFACKLDDEFMPTLDEESVGWCWAPIDSPPEPLHPGCRVALERLTANELGVARMMAEGRLTSPQRVANVTLWDMRITGTGYAYRRGREEHVWRIPEEWLTDDLVARCNGMPVVMEHPDTPMLDSKEFHKRIIGIVFVPYIDPDLQEVWGIVKVYDDAANEMLVQYQLSTSPGVLVGKDSHRFKLSSGKTILVEGDPLLVDHLAVCSLGTWDNGDEPVGVRMDSADGDVDLSVKWDAVTHRAQMARLDSAIRRLTRPSAG